MFNWDDPLAPTAPRMPEPSLEASIASAESTTAMPVGLDLRHTPGTGPKITDIPRPVISQVVAKPINADDKRVVNGLADINQLAPFKYPWAWDYFLNANKNH